MKNTIQSKPIKEVILQEIKAFFQLKKSDRQWHHSPLLAAICVGVPLLIGLYFNRLQAGLVASLAGMVILYFPASAPLASRMLILLLSSFGFLLSYTIGICFSFNPIVSAVVFGLFSMAVHWISLYFKTRPPGSFFFIMVAAIASCIPFHFETIPEKIGLMALGTMFSCLMALIYCLVFAKKEPLKSPTSPIIVNQYADFVEALITGLFMFGGLLLGHLLKLQNPYWIPTSCAAVMRGASLYHIWERVFHRLLGTLIGFGFCWIVLLVCKTPLRICICIMILQFIIEVLVVRHYALAVVFITSITILLAEAANPLLQNPTALLSARVLDILLGSAMGALSGWLLHHEKVRYHTVRRIRKIRVAFKRR